MEEVYEVTFENGNSYYFHYKENAINFILESYDEDFPMQSDEVYNFDKETLFNFGYVDNYAWISEGVFND